MYDNKIAAIKHFYFYHFLFLPHSESIYHRGTQRGNPPSLLSQEVGRLEQLKKCLGVIAD